MVKVIGVRFRTAGKIYFFDPLQFEIERGGHVIVETARGIEYGKVVTYNDISKIIAKKRNLKRMSSQAVGGAVGWNPICIIIPCHRVVGTNGSLTGYGGGIKNKMELLKLEENDMRKYFVPKKGTAL